MILSIHICGPLQGIQSKYFKPNQQGTINNDKTVTIWLCQIEIVSVSFKWKDQKPSLMKKKKKKKMLRSLIRKNLLSHNLSKYFFTIGSLVNLVISNC